MVYKRLTSIFIVIALIMLTGFYDSKEPDSLAYVVAVGIDKINESSDQYTFLFVNPLEIGFGGEGGGVSGTLKTIDVTAENFYSAVDKINGFLSKEVDFGQVKLIVAGRDTVENNFNKCINSFIRSKDFHPSTYVAVSEQSANEYLKNISPPLEANPVKHFENLFKKSFYLGSNNTTLREIYYNILTNEKEPVAVYVFEREKPTSENIINTAEQGLALFNNNRLIATLSDRESKIYYMIVGSVKNSHFSFETSDRQGGQISVIISESKKPQIRVNTDKGIKISVKFDLTCAFESSDTNINAAKNTPELENIIETELKKQIYGLVIKSAREYKTDFMGFEAYAKKNFLSYQDFKDYNFDEKYKHAEFDITVNARLKSTGIITS